MKQKAMGVEAIHRMVELNAEAVELERANQARVEEAMALEKQRVARTTDYYAKAEAHSNFIRQHMERQTLALERIAEAMQVGRETSDVSVRVHRDGKFWDWQLLEKDKRVAYGSVESASAALQAAAEVLATREEP